MQLGQVMVELAGVGPFVSGMNSHTTVKGGGGGRRRPRNIKKRAPTLSMLLAVANVLFGVLPIDTMSHFLPSSCSSTPSLTATTFLRSARPSLTRTPSAAGDAGRVWRTYFQAPAL